MSRKRTNDSHNGPSPSLSTGGLVPPLTLNSFHTDNNEPFSNYTTQKARRTSNGRMPVHIPVTEYDPHDYYAKTNFNLSPTVPQAQQYGSFGTSSTPSRSSAAPTTSDCTNPTMLTSTGMSRPNSQIGNTVCEGFNMLRLRSRASNASSNFDSTGQDSQSSTVRGFATDNGLSALNDSHLLDHIGGIVPEASQQPLLAPRSSSSLFSSASLSEDPIMQRTISTGSNNSTQYRTTSRGQQSAQGLHPLKPKLEETAPPMSRSNSSGHRIRIESADGSVKDKVSITKTPYIRPQQPKTFCTQCNVKPDGFRGEHELGRHINNAHSAIRTVWICHDISPEQNFLSSCQKCVRGKQYNAYYNAAAHLRRAHFNPRPKGRKGKNGDEETTKRAGSSGGEVPGMEFCKLWMREVHVDTTQSTSPENDADDDDENDTPINVVGAPAVQRGFQASQSVPLNRHDYGVRSISIPHLTTTTNAQGMSASHLPLSAPAPQFGDDDFLYFSQPSQTSSNSDKADVLDLSLDTNVNNELPFQMSPFVENPNLFDGFSDSRF